MTMPIPLMVLTSTISDRLAFIPETSFGILESLMSNQAVQRPVA